MTEDHNGFIWISTAKGLKRFDGFSLKSIPFPDEVDDSFVAIYADQKKKRIVCVNYYGEIYAIKNDSLNIGAITISKLSHSKPSDGFYRSIILKNDTSYLFKVDEKKRDLLCLTNDSLTNEKILNKPVLTPVYLTKKTQWYIINWVIVKKTPTSLDTIYKFSEDKKFISKIHTYYSSPNFYFYQNYWLKKIDLLTGVTKNICELKELPVDLINDIRTDEFKNIFLLTRKGAFVFDSTERYSHYLENENIINGISSKKNRCFYFATKNTGILRVPLNENYKKTNLPFKVRSISGENRLLFISDNDILYEKKGRSFFKLANLNGLALKNHVILNTFETKTGYIIVDDTHLFVISKNKKNYRGKFSESKNEGLYFYEFNASMKGCLKISDSLFYLTTWSGLNKLELKTDEISITLDRTLKGAMKIIFSKDTNLFLSKDKFIFKYSLKREKIIDTIKSSLAINTFAMYKNFAIIGNSNKGLNIIKDNSEIKLNTQNSNLIGNSINKITWYRSKLWMNANNYFQSLYVEENKVVFNQYPFLADLTIDDFIFIGDTCYLLKNKTELYQYNINEPAKTFKPRIYIDELNHNGSTNKNQALILPFSKNNLSIRIGIISFDNLKKKIYYKLISDNDKGNFKLLEGNLLTLNALESGNYAIEIYCATINSDTTDDASISNTITYRFSVKTPFWQTFTFILAILFLSIALITVIVIKYYRNKVKIQGEKHDNEYKILQLEQQLFKSLMNPHFIFNSLNSIQALINTNRPIEANKNISFFSALVRKNLLDSLDGFCTIEEELSRLKLYVQMENLRFNNSIHLAVTNLDQLPLSSLMIPAFTLQPLVENSILHGLVPKGGGEIMIIIRKCDTELIEITVLDNGIGLNSSLSRKSFEEKKSLALSLITKRLNNLKKIQNREYFFDIVNRLEFDKTQGTVCIIKIPQTVTKVII